MPGPSKAEIGGFHQQIAEEVSLRFGRPMSRRQVAQACRWIREWERRANEADDATRNEEDP